MMPNFINISKIREGVFDNLSRDGKSEVKVEKRTLVAKLKLKMSPDAEYTFSISALP